MGAGAAGTVRAPALRPGGLLGAKTASHLDEQLPTYLLHVLKRTKEKCVLCLFRV